MRFRTFTSVLYTFLLMLAANSCVLSAEKHKYIVNEGRAQGTFYKITYSQPDGKDLKEVIEKELKDFDLSLSTYKKESIISRINRNDSTVRTDSLFETMFSMAQQVSKHTDGAFDITVGSLVKVWGFGLGNNDHSKIPDLKSILPLVGYTKVRIENHRLLKSNPGVLVDANAIAQGLSSDVIASLLEKNGCKHYLVEIGGEIVCKGFNSEGKKWKVGIDKPVDDESGADEELQTVVNITDAAITTSGNYRKFYYLNGKKYAHTIDPRTGYPVGHNLLSATVVAPNCMMADAYATAFMVIGVDASLKLCKQVEGLECYLVYTDRQGKYQVVYTDGFKKYLTK